MEVGAKAGVDVAGTVSRRSGVTRQRRGPRPLRDQRGRRLPKGKDPYAWNVLFLNAGDGTFVRLAPDAAGASGFPYVRETTGAVADYDNDGFLDIYVNDEDVLPKGSLRTAT